MASKYRVTVKNNWRGSIEMIDWCYANCTGPWDTAKEKQSYESWLVTREFWLDGVNLDSESFVDFYFTSGDDVLHFKLVFGGFVVEKEEDTTEKDRKQTGSSV